MSIIKTFPKRYCKVFPMLERLDQEKKYHYLLLILAFLMPLTVSGANLIIVAICCLWLFSGNYKNKYLTIIDSKLMLASIIFFSLHVLGLIWTENILWGLEITHKMWYFLLLFPVLHSIVNKDYIRYYIFAFLIAITVTEVISYLVWFQIIDDFKNADYIMKNGLLIGCHQGLKKIDIKYIHSKIFNFINTKSA